MPGEDEILENQPVDETTVDEPVEESGEQSESEAAAEDKKVPYGALKEEREKRRKLGAELENERQARQLQELRALQMQQALLQQQQQAGQQDLDPEIAKNLKPYLAPLEQRLNMTEQMLYQKSQELEAERSIRYIEKHFPDIDDYREAIAEELEDLNPASRNAILGDPKAFVRFAKSIKAEADRIPETRATPAKQVIKSRAKSESGMSTNRQAQSKSISDLEGDEFTKALKNLGWDV